MVIYCVVLYLIYGVVCYDLKMDLWLATSKSKLPLMQPADEQPGCSKNLENGNLIPDIIVRVSTDKILKAHGQPSKYKKKKLTKFVSSWLNMPKFSGWLAKSEKRDDANNEYVFCKVCNSEIIAHKSILLKHQATEKHKTNWQKVSTSTKITDYGIENKHDEKAVKNAELKLCALLASYNLPFLLMDTLPSLLKKIFPDSKIAQKLNIKRFKSTNIMCESLGKSFLDNLYDALRKPGVFFSIILDETTDISIKKQCAFSVIYFDTDRNVIKNSFFDLFETKGSTAVELYDALRNNLISKAIPLTNLVGFSSDTTNVMVGEHSSLFSNLKKDFPHIVCVKCSCHMAHLAASKACLKLPKHVEDLLRNIGSHFNRSSLRRKKFEEFQIFFHVKIHKILSPSITRWLSIKSCVDRVLEQYQPLIAYFRESLFEDPSYITESMLEALSNSFTIIYLEFMSYVLGLMTDFNLLFQSEKSLLYKVKPETENLLRNLCANFIDISVIRKTSDIFKLSHINPTNFLPLEKIYLGILASESLKELKKNPHIPQEDFETFFRSILAFYVELVSNIKERFQFSDPIYEILKVVDPNEAQSFNIKSVNNVLERFPILKDYVDSQELDNEWRRHALLNLDDLQMSMNEPDIYWGKIFNLKNAANAPLFPNLKKMFSLLLVLPFSNAKVERIFSDVFNIKTDKRNLLNTDTVRAILATKEGIEGCGGCVNFTPSEKMLQSKIWKKKDSVGS
ncbi:uncharacterized protein LOC111692190 [Anoplophora glabripennis]|nr:uncharacterized protein LOC108905050 [Anoplophora glabripennis]XP_023311780.1 uncharacterized protein LOC111692190 [Anoplophora glabripennis]